MEITATMSGITFSHEPLKRLNEARVTPVDSLGMTSPESCKPRNAMNKPIPAGIAAFTAWGIASKIILRSPVTVRRIKMIPSRRTKTSAFA